MIGKREQAASGYREGFAGDCVADFQDVGAAAYLSYMPPRVNDVYVGDEGIVHPFADLMAECVNILNGHAENSRIAVGAERVGLRPGIVRAVVAEDAAAAARGQECVVVEEYGQGIGRDGQCGEQIHRDVVEEVDVNFSDAGARTGDGVAISTDVDRLQRLRRNRAEPHVVVRRRRADEVPEVGALESIDILRGADVGAARRERGILDQRRVLKAVLRILYVSAYRLAGGKVSPIAEMELKRNNHQRDVGSRRTERWIGADHKVGEGLIVEYEMPGPDRNLHSWIVWCWRIIGARDNGKHRLRALDIRRFSRYNLNLRNFLREARTHQQR